MCISSVETNDKEHFILILFSSYNSKLLLNNNNNSMVNTLSQPNCRLSSFFEMESTQNQFKILLVNKSLKIEHKMSSHLLLLIELILLFIVPGICRGILDSIVKVLTIL